MLPRDVLTAPHGIIRFEVRLMSEFIFTGNLPPPTTPEEVGARVLAQERFELVGDEVSYQNTNVLVLTRTMYYVTHL